MYTVSMYVITYVYQLDILSHIDIKTTTNDPKVSGPTTYENKGPYVCWLCYVTKASS